jgi:dienelactone hydrolase
VLTLPTTRIDLQPIVHRRIEAEGYTIESITYASEPKSRVTSLLYLPVNVDRPVAAVVVACGHGGSKSCLYAQYAGQLYAKMGFACFIPDTIGEEERETNGKMGARGHDMYHLKHDNPEFVRTKLKRMVLGKIVWDLMRAIDYLQTRKEIDKNRIGIVGYSLGGASGGCTAIVDDRVKAAVICGWVHRARYGQPGGSKYCTQMPFSEFTKMMGYDEMTALTAPHCQTLFMIGDSDSVMDHDEGGAAAIRDLRNHVLGAKRILRSAGDETYIQAAVMRGADHRPYFLSEKAVRWMQEHLQTPDQQRSIPEKNISFGQWVDSQGQRIEKLYNTEARERGLRVVDVGAVWRSPKQLACFPDQKKPSPEYTMKGWVESIVGEGAYGPEK